MPKLKSTKAKIFYWFTFNLLLITSVQYFVEWLDDSSNPDFWTGGGFLKTIFISSILALILSVVIVKIEATAAKK
ncbi:hypothetical protein CEQ90_07600 [Lewinellaceae bacterium SD302]|nr:hypothetical protein CEQ90_07600 [Lewinellaceae bacterium SD302]